LAEIDIEYVEQVAREAGKRALSRLGSFQAEIKADNSYVTEIDRDTETFVRQRLEERYPDYAFLGEEFGRHGRDDAPLWAVDPIDGTTNLVFGIPLWCVSIGLLVQGEPVGGAVYLPCLDEMFTGVKGQGAYCNGVRLAAKDRDRLHPEDTLGFTSAAIKNLDSSALRGRLRCLGSIAADIVYTARGSLGCLVGWSEGAYDMAAALCIAYEAGCIARYLTGEPLDLGVVLRDSKTLAPFAVAPPGMVKLLQANIQRRI
jgi:fructose-1,6-bisphosphatase/inositol monophosphatase family enzyme